MPAFFAPDEAATQAIGSAIAPELSPGQVVTLDGDLGAGKTALARSIIRARLGQPQLEVPSPSFAIVQPYPGIVHADLYRLADESEIDELGLWENDDDIVLVEWPQRAPSLLRRPGLRISLSIAPAGGRLIDIEVQGSDPAELFAALAPWHAGAAQ